MSAFVYTASAQPLRLGQKLGTGGEGVVFAVQDAPDLVAKLYHEPPSPARSEKLALLAQLGNERLFKLTAWPVEVLHAQPGGSVAGFTMKRIGHAEEVHTLHSPRSRLQKFPEASWAFLLHTAANIARAVAAVHEHGLIVGDLNPKNILVTRQATVFLLDCDSFQVHADGKTYRCESGFPDYTPPELQGVVFREVDRDLTHDAFGLAVVIFQLLFLGRHPFSGKFLGAGEMPLERAIRERRFAYGAESAARQMQAPPGTLAAEAVSPPVLALFQRAFLATNATERPQPREWIEALDALAQNLRPCELHSGHRFYRELAACPWCGIEQLARTRLFNVTLNGAAPASSYFRLTDIWREIASVPEPATALMPKPAALTVLPSPATLTVARKRRYNFYLALLLAVVSGLCLGFLPLKWITVILLGTLAKVAKHIAEAEPYIDDLLKLGFGSAPGYPASDFIKKLEAEKTQAEELQQQLEERWQREASAAAYQAKWHELTEQKAAYELLPAAQRGKLVELEDAAKATQLVEYLEQFPLEASTVKGIGLGLTWSLHTRGIRTAADVTGPRLNNVSGIGSARRQTLLDWRSELEAGFVFDAKRAAASPVRAQLIEEFDRTRQQLERELSQGAEHLRRLQQSAEASQRALATPLQQAQLKVAQVTTDWETATKRPPAWQAPTVLVLAFLLGLGGQTWMNLADDTEQHALTSSPHLEAPPLQLPQIPRGDKQDEARRLLNVANEHRTAGRLTEAIESYEEAAQLDPQFSGAWHALGEAYLAVGEDLKAVRATEQALRINQTFDAFYVLGTAQLRLKNYSAARQAFENASRVNWGTRSPNYWLANFELTKTIIAQNEAAAEIDALHGLLEQGPELIEERFQLAALYFLTGQREAGLAELTKLRGEDVNAAAALRQILLDNKLL